MNSINQIVPAITEQNWTIQMIEALQEQDAQAMALEVMQIKDHAVYFVDFGGYFKYSALVFAEGRHIYYANEYELHYEHCKLTREALRERFIEKLNGKLYTEAEIMGTITTYDEYKAKSNYLHNYYGMRREHLSIFCINPSDDERKAFAERTKTMTLDPVAFAYYDDAGFVRHHMALNDALENAWEMRKNDYDVMKSAFIYEMWNHEYAINYQGDYDVLSVYGNIHFHRGDYADELNDYFDQLGFTETQRRAYLDARREYLKQANEDC